MAMAAGMNRHISKPIDVNVLENEIINIFKKVLNWFKSQGQISDSSC